MKFKIQDKQNQLFERISDQHLVVGVDIASQARVARAVNYRRIVLGDPIFVGNHKEGFNRLLQWIEKCLWQKKRSNEMSFLK